VRGTDAGSAHRCGFARRPAYRLPRKKLQIGRDTHLPNTALGAPLGQGTGGERFTLLMPFTESSGFVRNATGFLLGTAAGFPGSQGAPDIGLDVADCSRRNEAGRAGAIVIYRQQARPFYTGDSTDSEGWSKETCARAKAVIAIENTRMLE